MDYLSRQMENTPHACHVRLVYLEGGSPYYDTRAGLQGCSKASYQVGTNDLGFRV